MAGRSFCFIINWGGSKSRHLYHSKPLQRNARHIARLEFRVNFTVKFTEPSNVSVVDNI